MIKSRLYAILFAALVGAYLGLSLFLPQDPAVAARHDLSFLQLRLLSLTIAVPLTFIWCAAFYGFITLRRYAGLIYKSVDGKALMNIANGLQWLSLGLPFMAVINSLLNYYSRINPDFTTEALVIRNYVTLVIYFVSFIFISRGAYMLVNYVRKKPEYGEQNVWVMLHIILAVFYTYILVGPINNGADTALSFMPDWLMLTTIAIPYIFLWYTGFRSAYRLHFYGRMVKGAIYQRSLSNLTLGILFIILSTILLQLLTSLSAQIERLSLTPLLIIVYLLLAIIGVGYFLVAAGAKSLKQLEEV